MEIVRYGLLVGGQVVKEVSKYAQAGTGVVSESDSRLVSLPGETGQWLLCSVVNQLPSGSTETTEAAYIQYQQDATDLGMYSPEIG